MGRPELPEDGFWLGDAQKVLDEWYREKAPRGVRGRGNPKRSHMVDLVETVDSLSDTLPRCPAPMADARRDLTRTPTKRTKTIGGRRYEVALTADEYHRQQAARATTHAADQDFVSESRMGEGVAPAADARRQAAAIRRTLRKRARREQRREHIRPTVTEDPDTQALVADWRAQAHCVHCGSQGVRAKSLCSPCYQYQRRHRGQLPPADLLSGRTWARDYPITD